MMEWLDSYANHILYCSVYTGVGAYAVKSSRTSSSSSWNVLALMVGGVAALNLYAELSYAFKRIGLPPGNSGYPVMGHMIEWIGNPRAFVTKKMRKHGFPFTVNFFMKPNFVLSSDEDVRWANVQERKGTLVPAMPDHMRDLMGRESIIFQISSDHRRLRKMFEPSFAPSAIQAYAQIIDATSKVELEKWCTKGDFCSSKEWSMLAMRLFFACAFGNVDEDSLEILTNLFSAWFEGFMAIIPFAIPGTRLYNAHRAGKEIASLLQKMVDDFKSKNLHGSPGAKTSMMGRLCYGVDDDGKTLTDEQLAENIRFIIFAGHDTTKGSFCGFVHYLAQYPKLRVMLTDEVKGFSEPLDVDQLKAAPLLNAFLAETWRMVPPTDGHGMEVATDLEYKGFKLRKGVAVKVDITCDCVTNDERYPDPTEFRVERWLPKDHPLHDPKYYLDKVDYNVMSVKFRAFNTGPHMCLGAHFAKLEARIVLTRLLQNYDIEIRNDTLNTFPLLQYTNDFKLTKL
jgi:(+)-abscisic acid 8'-hydroxylase